MANQLFPLSAVVRWGCFNRPDYAESLQVQDGWTEDGRRNMVPIPHVMTRDCQYSKEAEDRKCGGCKWEAVKSTQVPRG